MFVLVRMKGSKAFQTLQRIRSAYCIRYQICTVARAQEWDFTAQVVCWHCAFAQLGGNTASECRTL